jgi:hypothetical protein
VDKWCEGKLATIVRWQSDKGSVGWVIEMDEGVVGNRLLIDSWMVTRVESPVGVTTPSASLVPGPRSDEDIIADVIAGDTGSDTADKQSGGPGRAMTIVQLRKLY